MAFEGHYQYWCKNGHYWKGSGNSEKVYHEYGFDCVYGEEICPECGEHRIVENLVDNTNHDDYGRIFDESKTPTILDTENLSPEKYFSSSKVCCCNGHVSEIVFNPMGANRCLVIGEDKRMCGAPYSEFVD